MGALANQSFVLMGDKLARLLHDVVLLAAAMGAAHAGNNAKAAGMIAALSDFDIGGISGRGENAGRVVVVKIVGQIGDGAIPGIAGEAALGAAVIGFGSE